MKRFRFLSHKIVMIQAIIRECFYKIIKMNMNCRQNKFREKRILFHKLLVSPTPIHNLLCKYMCRTIQRLIFRVVKNVVACGAFSGYLDGAIFEKKKKVIIIQPTNPFLFQLIHNMDSSNYSISPRKYFPSFLSILLQFLLTFKKIFCTITKCCAININHASGHP